MKDNLNRQFGKHAGSKKRIQPNIHSKQTKAKNLFAGWTQHERVVAFRARRMGISVKMYAAQYGSKNLPHLIKD